MFKIIILSQRINYLEFLISRENCECKIIKVKFHIKNDKLQYKNLKKLKYILYIYYLNTKVFIVLFILFIFYFLKVN